MHIRSLIPALYFLGSLFFLSSCVSQDQVLPASSGRSGEVIVVAPELFWSTPAGEYLDSVFTAPLPYLPQGEPRFSLIKVLPQNFSSILRIHRNVLLVAASTREFDADQVRNKGMEGMVVLLKDHYAKGQLLFVFRPQAGANELLDFMKNKAAVLADKIEREEMERLARFYEKVRDQELSGKVEAHMNIQMNVPRDYYLAVQNKDMVWLRSETGNRSLNVLMQVYQGSPDPTRIVELRNQLGRAYIPGPVDGTFMQTEERVPLKLDTVRMDNRVVTRALGLWRLEGDFMGGPFAAYLIPLDQDRWLYAEGFVYAPGAEKRELLRNLMGLIQSLRPQ